MGADRTLRMTAPRSAPGPPLEQDGIFGEPALEIGLGKKAWDPRLHESRERGR